MYVNSSYIEIEFVDYRETTREDTMSRMLLLLPLVTVKSRTVIGSENAV